MDARHEITLTTGSSGRAVACSGEDLLRNVSPCEPYRQKCQEASSGCHLSAGSRVPAALWPVITFEMFLTSNVPLQRTVYSIAAHSLTQGREQLPSVHPVGQQVHGLYHPEATSVASNDFANWTAALQCQTSMSRS